MEISLNLLWLGIALISIGIWIFRWRIGCLRDFWGRRARLRVNTAVPIYLSHRRSAPTSRGG
jgi:hypothetical protein